jgi:hypothetical protein
MKIEAAAWYACDNIFLMKLFVRDLATLRK